MNRCFKTKSVPSHTRPSPSKGIGLRILKASIDLFLQSWNHLLETFLLVCTQCAYGMDLFDAILAKSDFRGKIRELRNFRFNICTFSCVHTSEPRKNRLGQTSPCVCHRQCCTTLATFCPH